MTARAVPWQYELGVDLDALPRDTTVTGPDGEKCTAEWAGTADAGGLPWKCTEGPGHEPANHRAGNGREVVAEWPSVEPLVGAPNLAVDEVWDAEGRRWYRDEESLADVWRCDGGSEIGAVPSEVLAEVFGPLRVEAESW